MESEPTDTKAIHARFSLAYPVREQTPFSLDIDTTLPGQGITAIFGHSGSGKTTLLRCIAGLQKADDGKLSVNGTVWQDATIFLPTHLRPLGYVFQEASLFPHLTAKGNLDYAMKRSNGKHSRDFYAHVLSLMGIESLLHRYPENLSGGERQRVAIARALLINPRLLLMDEPLASLDTERKQEILPYLERLHADFAMPILYVTHSLDEVARLADYVVIMDRGRIAAHGVLMDVLSRIDLPVRLGEDAGVLIEGRVAERDIHWHLVRVEFPGGNLWVRDGGDALGQSLRIRVLARDVSIALSHHEDTSILNRIPAEVAEVGEGGDAAVSMVRLKVGPCTLVARLTRKSVEHLHLEKGKQVWAQIKSVAIVR